jgi:hypothetical protein
MAKTLLVCALADSPLVVEGSTFDRWCVSCGGKVQLAPSGQKIIESQGEANVVLTCTVCFGDRSLAGSTLASTEDTIAQELRTAKPNLRRCRN